MPALSDLRGQITPPTRQDDAEPGDAPDPIRARATRHRLMVLGADESEVVSAAGGLIYDWSLAGWDIEVHLAASRDDRPLRILGAKTKPLTSPDSLRSDPLWPDAIIASSRLYHQNRSVRDYFTEASRRNYAATAVLGADWPTGLGHGVVQAEHRLSPAARAFKLQAMLAAQLDPAAQDSAEIFRGSTQRFPLDSLIGVAPS